MSQAMFRNLKSLCSLIVAAGAICITTASAHAGVVFQADFNGSDSGTGGATDVVTLGGTGEIWNLNGDGSSGGVESSNPLGSGSYLHTAASGVNGGGAGTQAHFIPTSSASSLGAMTSSSGGQILLNGGLDFFIRVNSAVQEDDAMRAIDTFDNRNIGGLDLRIDSNIGGSNFVAVIDAPTDGLGVGLDPFVYIAGPVDYAGALAGQVLHVGLTFETNASTGEVTMKFFTREDGGAIDTTSGDDLLGTVVFNINETVVSLGLDEGDFFFGDGFRHQGDPKSVDFDVFRIYDSTPTEFSAIAVPEPATLVLGGASLLLLAGRRRSR